MKKTTYVLIALVGALFAGLFLFLLFLSFHPSDNKWDIVKIEGNVQEKTLSDFSRIEVIDSMDEYYFYDDNYGKTLSPIFCISVSDSVSAPSISMKEGWKEFISYAVADSTLTVTFKSTNKDISVQDTPVVITVPSLSYAKLNYRGKTKISGVTSKNLKIDALYHLYLDSISADSVELKFMDTESLVSLDVNH